MKILIFFFFYLHFNHNHFQVTSEASPWDFMIGEWEVTALHLNQNGSEIEEVGEAKISTILDNTYLSIEVNLCHGDNCRSYLQLLSINELPSSVKSIYFYSGNQVQVQETGAWDENRMILNLEGLNPWARENENGVNIKSKVFQFRQNVWKLEVIELRNGRWDLGYQSTFTRK